MAHTLFSVVLACPSSHGARLRETCSSVEGPAAAAAAVAAAVAVAAVEEILGGLCEKQTQCQLSAGSGSGVTKFQERRN